jgi:hypothetical protein
MTLLAPNFTAGASATGYLYQCRYALRMLLDRIARNELDAEASVERFDDIAFEKAGQPVELIQTKHHLGTPSDLSDQGPDLWKTLRVWSEGLTGGLFQVPQAALTIVTTAASAAGSAAECLKPGPSRNPTKALRLINKASRQMTGTTLEPARKAFRSLTRPMQEALIGSVYVLDRSPDINDSSAAIRTALGRPVRTEHMPAFQERLEGWWFGQLIPRLSGAVKSAIRATDLIAFIDDLRDSFRQDSLPIDYATGAPPDIGVVVDDSFVFVRQLALIGMLPQRITQATTDYRRAYAQRSRWLRDNLLMATHLDKYDEQLVGDWEWMFLGMEQETAGATESVVLERSGRQLYERLLEIPRCIRESCTEAFVGRGSYHSLADKKVVGWHRDFRTQII